MEMALRPFEEQIIDHFKTFDIIVGGGKSRPRKGIWIKGHLEDVREDFIYGMWERWGRFVLAARAREADIELGSYIALATYVYLLKRAGLLIPGRREKGKSPKFLRQYYRLNLSRINDPLWRNPYGPYPSTKRWKRQGFPRPKKKPRPLYPPGMPPPVFLSAEELSRIWAAAETFLSAHRYTITRRDLEEIYPDWGVETVGYKTFRDRVAFIIHESVEIEEVSTVAARLTDPRLAPEPVAIKAHQIADRLQKEYLSTAG